MKNVTGRTELAPIVLFAYNRPHYLLKTLQSLQANMKAKESELFIYCDGPKANADAKELALIEQVRQIANAQHWCKNLYVKESSTNCGLSQSIITGVTEIVNKYGKIIVLEDDIVVSPFFLKYMNEALETYKNVDRIGSISGHNYPVKNAVNNKETLFLKSASTWGWATWKRAWDLFTNDTKYLIDELTRKKMTFDFNFNNSYNYFGILKKVSKNKISSWGVCWYASLFLNDKLCLFPATSLVENIGMVGTNIKSDRSEFIGNVLYDKPIEVFGTDIQEDAIFRSKLIEHYRRNNRRKISWENFKYVIYNPRKVFNLIINR